MTKLVGIVAVQVATCASILGLYFTLLPPSAERPLWHWLLIAFAITACLLLAVREVVDYLKFAPKIYRSPQEINLYMHRWVSAAGRVVIFSRDMSWTDDGNIRQLLLKKASRNELTVCLEHAIPLTDDLCKNGARIVTYGVLGHIPRARFTIVDFDREGARVAVGVKVGNDHVIQEFRSGHDPFFAVAEDLVKFLFAYAQHSANVPEH